MLNDTIWYRLVIPYGIAKQHLNDNSCNVVSLNNVLEIDPPNYMMIPTYRYSYDIILKKGYFNTYPLVGQRDISQLVNNPEKQLHEFEAGVLLSTFEAYNAYDSVEIDAGYGISIEQYLFCKDMKQDFYFHDASLKIIHKNDTIKLTTGFEELLVLRSSLEIHPASVQIEATVNKEKAVRHRCHLNCF